jgi:hypothetical protein
MTVRYTIFRLLVKLNQAAREFPRNITFAPSAQLCGKGHKHIYQSLHMKLPGILLVYWDSEKNVLVVVFWHQVCVKLTAGRCVSARLRLHPAPLGKSYLGSFVFHDA